MLLTLYQDPLPTYVELERVGSYQTPSEKFKMAEVTQVCYSRLDESYQVFFVFKVSPFMFYE